MVAVAGAYKAAVAVEAALQRLPAEAVEAAVDNNRRIHRAVVDNIQPLRLVLQGTNKSGTF